MIVSQRRMPRQARMLIKLAASAPYGVPLRGAHVLELGPGEGHGTRALLAYEPATVTAVEVLTLSKDASRRTTCSQMLSIVEF